ncbi:hypothetical protein CPI84_13690 [Erwinia pyrifoliae]|nr:hypothetical protein CPI84_13690 [Erwinia pyrifoliae]
MRGGARQQCKLFSHPLNSVKAAFLRKRLASRPVRPGSGSGQAFAGGVFFIRQLHEFHLPRNRFAPEQDIKRPDGSQCRYNTLQATTDRYRNAAPQKPGHSGEGTKVGA